MPDPALHLLLLGPPTLADTATGRQLALERRDAVLLARLAIDGPQPRDALALWTWPQSPRDKALNSLRQRLFRLRQQAGVEVVAGQRTLALSTGVAHDAGLLVVDRDPTSADAPDDAEFLQGCDFSQEPALQHWVDAVRQRWQAARQQRWLARAQSLEAKSDLPAARGAAERACRLDPADERAHALLMRLHYLAGDTAEALDAYRRCVDALRRELDAEPSPTTRALATLIRRGAVESRAPDPAVPAALLRPPRLLGRAAELQRLHAAIRPSAVVVVAGEAGIGRSRLLDTFAREAGLPVTVRQTVPLGVGTQPPGALHALVAGWATALGETPADPSLDSLLRGLRARGVPAVVVDDLQFADEATQDRLLDLWTPLSADAADLPALVVALRPAGASARWQQVLAEGRALITLQPWPTGVIDTLLQDLHGAGVPCDLLAEDIARQTGGVPALVLALLRAGQPGAPDAHHTLGPLLQARIDQLPSPAQRLLRVAALAGPAFDAALAAEVLGGHALDLVAPWRALESARLLEGGRIASSALVDAVRAGLPRPIAAALSATLAQALAARGAEPAAIAMLWAEAERWPEAAGAHEVAARHAWQRARRTDELDHLQAAESAWQQAGQADQAFRCALASVEAATVVWPADRVDTLLDRLAAATDAQDRALDVLLARARHRISKADLAAAREPAEAALSLARALNDGPRQVAAAGWLGLALSAGSTAEGEAERGHMLLQQHRAIAETTPDKLRLDFFGALGYAMFLARDYPAAEDASQRALDIAQQLGDTSEVMVQASNLLVIHGVLGQRGRALRAAETAHGAWDRLGRPAGVDAAGSCQQVATLFLAEGRYRDALALLDWCRAQFIEGQAPILAAMTELRLARLHLRLGQPQKAQQALTPLPPQAPAGTVLARAIVQSRIDEALRARPPARLFDDVAQALAAAGDGVALADGVSARLRLSALAPTADEALVWGEQAQAAAEAGADQPARLSALVRVADAQARLGRTAPALPACRQALLLARGTLPLDMEPVELWWLAHRTLQVAGAPDEAARAWQEARRWIEQAAAHVPDEYMDSYRHRHPLHRAILAAPAANTPAGTGRRA